WYGGCQPWRGWCIKVANDASITSWLPARGVRAGGWRRRLRQRGAPEQLAAVAWAVGQRCRAARQSADPLERDQQYPLENPVAGQRTFFAHRLRRCGLRPGRFACRRGAEARL